MKQENHMKQEIPIQQSQVTTPLSTRRKATGRRALLGNGAGGEAFEFLDGYVHRYRCIMSDSQHILQRGRDYWIQRIGQHYLIQEECLAIAEHNLRKYFKRITLSDHGQ